MHGHEEFWLGQRQHQLVVLLAAVARDVDALALAVDHLRSHHHQPVDGVHHRDGVAGDRAGREDDRVGGLHLHLGMFTAGDAAEGRQRFALAAGHQQKGFAVGQVADLLDGNEQVVGGTHVAELAGLGDHVEHRAAQQAHLAAVLHRQFEDHRNAMDRAGEGGDDHPAVCLADVAIQIREHGPLRRSETGDLGVGGIAEQAQHPLLAVVGQALQVEGLPIDGGVVELEVAGEDDHAGGRRDGQREAVGHRVGVTDELHLEVLADMHDIPRADRLDGGAVGDARLLHLPLQHRHRQAGAVDDRDVEVLEVVRDAADVIFVAVGDDHAADALLVLAQIAGVGHHHIDAVHAVAGEGETGIDEHQLIAVFEDAGVLADLVQAAQRNDAQALVLGFGAVAGADDGIDVLTGHVGKERVGSGREREAEADVTLEISLGVRWDAGRPGSRKGAVARRYRRKEGEVGGHPPASR